MECDMMELLRFTPGLLLLFLVSNARQAEAQETPGWSCGDHRFCYQLWSEKVDLDTAKVKCKRQGKQAQENQETIYISCPRNAMDIEKIYKYIKDSKEEYWIGAVSLPNSNEWKCADDASSPVGNITWAQGHPNASSLHAFIINGTVVSTKEEEKTTNRSFICQKKNEAYSSKPDATTRQTARPTTQPPQTSPKITESPDKRRMADSEISTHVNFIECGNNTCLHSNASNTNYYYGASGNYNWTEVAKLCMNMNAHLATPSTLKKHQELVAYIRVLPDFISKSNTWIGLYYPKETGVKETELGNRRMGWKWIDNSTYDVTVSQWAAEEPTNDERFVRIRNEKWFAVFDASDAKYFICEKDCKEPGSNCFSTESSSPAPSQTAVSSSSGTRTTSLAPSTERSSVTTSTSSYPSLSATSKQTFSSSPSTTATTSMATDSNDSNDVTFMPNAQACGDSTSSWKYSSASNMCYLLETTQKLESDQVMSWQEAKEECERISGNLVCPSTAAKHEEVVQLIDMGKIPTLNVWIGLQCKNNVMRNFMCYEWRWVDGSAYDNSWHKWANNEPGRGETLARIRDEQWYAAIDDRDAEYYICEKAANWTKLPSPNTSPSTKTSQATTDRNESGNTNGSFKESGNLSLLAILILVLPFALIVLLVILVKRGQIDIHKYIKPLKFGKKENDIEAAATEPDPDPYYLVTDTEIPVSRLEEFSVKPDRVIGMHLEFGSIPAHMGLPQLVASKAVNKTKNRFKDVKPFDTNRVVLNAIEGDESSDYVNASFVDGYEHPKAFIASAGPTDHSIKDFWRMIWEQQVKCVIMLTKLNEGAKEMCKRYWPKTNGEKMKFGDVDVELDQEDKLADYTCRHLKVKKGDEERWVTQLHIETWLDMKILETAIGILHLRREMRKFMYTNSPPIVVHCRAGVGRSGTYLAIDYLLQQAASEGVIDVAKCVAELRKQRVKMVQNIDQYEFLYQAVTEGILLGNTCIPVSQFLEKYPEIFKAKPSGSSPLDYEFKLMSDSTTSEPTRRKSSGHHSINRHKNRSPKVVAEDSFRISLATKTEGRNDYINAVGVDSFERKYAFIATQAPLAGTAVDLWRAVWDCKCHTIVMLCTQEELDEEEIYYPVKEGGTCSQQPFQIKCTSIKPREGVSCKDYKLSLTGCKDRQIQHICISSELNSKSSEELLGVFHEIYHLIKKRKTVHSKRAPTLIHCLDGAEYTGMYCAFSSLLDTIESDKEIDVFQSARLVRQSRVQFIFMKEQYKQLYEMMFYFVKDKEMYDQAAALLQEEEVPLKKEEKIYDNVKDLSATNTAVVNNNPGAIYVNVPTAVPQKTEDGAKAEKITEKE